MKRIHLPSQNVIFWADFCLKTIFGSQRPSWIVRKMKYFSVGLFLGSISMSMPNFVQIRWTVFIYQAELWFSTQFWWNSSFDHRQPSWILRNMKNASLVVFARSSSMSMLNFVQIGWTVLIYQTKMLFSTHNFVEIQFLTTGSHLGF